MFKKARESWRKRRQRIAGDKLLAYLHEAQPVQMKPPTNSAVIRRLSDEGLNRLLAQTPDEDASHIALERERSRRDAWRSPAGVGIWIAALGGVTGFISLVITILDRR